MLMTTFPHTRRSIRETLLALVGAVILLSPSPSTAQQAPAQPPAPKRLLFLTHAGLYRHASLANAELAVQELGRAGGFEVTTVEGYRQEPDALDFSFLTPEYLESFDGLMMMTNGNLPLTEIQRAAIIDFVRNGKGFIGVHNASLTLYDYPRFGEMLGGYFRRPIAQDRLFVLKVEDRDHPSTRMLGPSWPMIDEFYYFGTAAYDPARPEENIDVLFGNQIPLGFSRDRVKVLLSIDTELSNIEGVPDMVTGGDYPQAWYSEFGEGRSFYTSLGHREDIWLGHPVFRAHVLGGIRWALGLEE
jgi:type 1 glutamine amidotransferase